jgi:hypothetical protein
MEGNHIRKRVSFGSMNLSIRARPMRMLIVAVSIFLSAQTAAWAAVTPTVNIVGGPLAWTAQTTATFRFSTSEPTRLECRIDAPDDVAAWRPCEDGHRIEGLLEGRHVLEVRPAGRSDAPPQDSWMWRVDVTPPTVPTLFDPERLWQRARYVTVSWSASDSLSGLGSYDIRYDTWTASGVARANVPWVTRTKITGATFIASPGRTYCFEATARDRAGNRAPGWSSGRCFVLPLAGGSLEREGPWIRRTDVPGYFLDGYIQTKQRWAWARREVVAKRIVLVATRCPSCGSVAVRWRGRVVRTIDLRAATLRRSQLIEVRTFARPRRGTLRLDVVSRGKTVRIEGLGVSAV